jgi:hypothetical protein
MVTITDEMMQKGMADAVAIGRVMSRLANTLQVPGNVFFEAVHGAAIAAYLNSMPRDATVMEILEATAGWLDRRNAELRRK